MDTLGFPGINSEEDSPKLLPPKNNIKPNPAPTPHENRVNIETQRIHVDTL